MVSILQSLSKTIHLSIILAVLLFIGLFLGGGDWAFDQLFWSWLFRYFHVLAGIMWIGLLWYLNFVQISKDRKGIYAKAVFLLTSPSLAFLLPRDKLPVSCVFFRDTFLGLFSCHSV